MAKTRTRVPTEVAARVQFAADRTCCVCRVEGKKVQIHHLDENPTNHDSQNLAVVCTDCHEDTMLKGGFTRKLDGDQVRLYRDDWNRVVAQRRARQAADVDSASEDATRRIRRVTSIAEAYRESGQFSLLADFYDALGNAELRDKYIEIVLSEENPPDSEIIHLRSMQKRPDLIPDEVVAREEAAYNESGDLLQRARFYFDLGRHRQAALDYVEGIAESLHEGRVFSAAFYLKELAASGIAQELFVEALRKSAEDDELWWQVRALQELGWHTELKALLLEHAAEIDEDGPLMLKMLLADARGDEDERDRIRVLIASGSRLFASEGAGSLVFTPSETEEDPPQAT